MNRDSKFKDVAAIVTAMTDGERPFLQDALKAVLEDPGISQVLLCVEQNNTWIDAVISILASDPRLEIIRLPLAPPGAIRNKALSYVRLPWIAYCDGDDVWCLGKTQIQRAHADKTNSEFVGGDHYLIDEAGQIKAFALSRNIPMLSSWMVKTEVMRRYPFDESVLNRGIEDGVFWICTTGKFRRARCARMLLKYRVRSSSLSSSSPSKQRKARIVELANIPVLRELILLSTWCLWFTTRKREYVWLSKWRKEPNNVSPIS
jgi:hypothetical protein